jgi:hypothetical protein
MHIGRCGGYCNAAQQFICLCKKKNNSFGCIGEQRVLVFVDARWQAGVIHFQQFFYWMSYC